MNIFRIFFGSAIIYLRSQNGLGEESIYVFPEVYEERQGTSEKVLVIHDGYSLNLRRASVLADTLLLRDETEDGIIDTYVDGAQYERYLYKDALNQASLLVTPRSEGKYKIVGLLNLTHRIEPLTSSERSSAGRNPHRISKVIVEDGIYAVAEEAEHKFEERANVHRKGGQSLPTDFTIELYFISDLEHTKKFKKNADHVEYVTLFMLSVSLQLQQLHPPGSILIKAIHGTYTKKQLYVNLTTDGRLLADETLIQLSMHTWKSSAVLRSDIFYLATGRDAAYHHNGAISSALLGLAHVKGACNEKTKFAVGEDITEPFSGVHTAIHEIGHLIGAKHDGEDYSIVACRAENGYIMSPTSGGIRNYLFSLCSKLAFNEFLRSPDSSCLKDVISQSRIVLLPQDRVPKKGAAVNRAEYCWQYFAYREASYDPVGTADDQCSFRCKLVGKNGKAEYAEIWAPDAIPCDKSDAKRKCRSGVCLPVNKSPRIGQKNQIIKP